MISKIFFVIQIIFQKTFEFVFKTFARLNCSTKSLTYYAPEQTVVVSNDHAEDLPVDDLRIDLPFEDSHTELIKPLHHDIPRVASTESLQMAQLDEFPMPSKILAIVSSGKTTPDFEESIQ